MRTLRSTLWPLLAVGWCIAASTSAAGSLYIAVPIFGNLRWDVAFLVLAVAATLRRFAPRLGLASVIGLFAASSAYDRMPRYFHKPLSFVRTMTLQSAQESAPVVREPSIAVVPHALSASARAAIVTSTLAHSDLWTHATLTACLGYFNMGPARNFDYNGNAADAPWWSFSLGFRWSIGNPAIFATGSGKATRRAARRITTRWNLTEVEAAAAAHLGVTWPHRTLLSL